MAVELQRPDEKLILQRQKLRQELRQPKKGVGKAHSKAAGRRLSVLSAQLSASRAIYYCLMGAVLIASFCYHEFGMHDGSNGFHGVFPYHSLIEPLNRLP